MVFAMVSLAFAALLIWSDLFANKTLLIIMGVIGFLFLIIAPALYFKNFKTSRRIVSLFLSLLLMGGYAVVAGHILGTLDFLEGISGIMNIARPVEVVRKPFNVYLTGLDTAGEIDTDARTDVNMIITVNPETRHVLITSIPRDCYVELPDLPETYDKLTHTGLKGAAYTVQTAEKLTGLEINYYVKVNYSTVTEFVDAIGGIDVFSDYDFLAVDAYWVSYGENHLDGDMTLAFVRERKSFDDGDLQRNRNQGKVVAAVIKKLTTSTTLLTNYTAILDAIAPYLETNMSADEIKALVRMQQEDMSGWRVENQSITGFNDSMPCYAMDGDYAAVVMPDEESLRDAIEAINRVLQEEKE